MAVVLTLTLLTSLSLASSLFGLPDACNTSEADCSEWADSSVSLVQRRADVVQHSSLAEDQPVASNPVNLNVDEFEALRKVVTALSRGQTLHLTNEDPAAMLVQKRIKVVCIGDSLTKGDCAHKGNSYPEHLQTLLGPAFDVQNWASDGMRVMKNHSFSLWKRWQMDKLLHSPPDVLVPMFGSLLGDGEEDAFVKDYKSFLTAVKNASSTIQVYPMIPPPHYESDDVIKSKRFDTEVPHMIRTVLDGSRLTTINLHKVFKARCPKVEAECEWMCSKCPCIKGNSHPNDTGYLKIAKMVAAALANTAHKWSFE